MSRNDECTAVIDACIWYSACSHDLTSKQYSLVFSFVQLVSLGTIKIF